MTEPHGPNLYYVDEAGDSTIFNSKGKVIVDTPGCTRFFIMGLLEIGDITSLHESLEKKRYELLEDPYFKGVPSFQPEAKKTALKFHAKDDLPEVRKEIFQILRGREDLRFFAVVSDKFSTLEYILGRQRHDPAYRYHPNEAYDYLVRILFHQRLQKAKGYEVVFAERGNKQRDKALKEQLEIVQARDGNHGEDLAELDVISGRPDDFAGLQAVDYFLWALQRLYLRGEERYLELLWPQCKLVRDIHDTREKKYGRYYDKRNQLTWKKIEGRM